MSYLMSAASYVLANAVGLALAAVLLPGFQISFLSFAVVVLLFSAVLLLAEPLLRMLANSTVPQMAGGISLVAIFFGLLLTDWALSGLVIGGIANWLAATLLIWLGSIGATIVLPLLLLRKAKAR